MLLWSLIILDISIKYIRFTLFNIIITNISNFLSTHIIIFILYPLYNISFILHLKIRNKFPIYLFKDRWRKRYLFMIIYFPCDYCFIHVNFNTHNILSFIPISFLKISQLSLCLTIINKFIISITNCIARVPGILSIFLSIRISNTNLNNMILVYFDDSKSKSIDCLLWY